MSELKPKKDQVTIEINWEELNTLIGRILTLTDATFTDVEQREAQKRLLKDTITHWYELEERSQNPEFAKTHAYRTI